MPPSSDLKAFQEILSSSKNIIAVAGAGLSAASGIPTFRGAGGMWRRYNAMELATPDGFAESPSLVWQFYHYRRETALKANPNDAHRALAAFSVPSLRNQITPDSSFELITQNVDGLSARANAELEASLSPSESESPRKSMYEIHGRLFDILCYDEKCGHVDFNTTSPICEALRGTEEILERRDMDSEIDEERLPRCSKCGHLARPGVVWFGEMPQRLPEIDKLVKRADLCLVVGTSSVVHPAAGYANKVKKRGGKVAVFNLERSKGDDQADFLFLGPCEDILPKALGLSVAEDGRVSVQEATQ